MSLHILMVTDIPFDTGSWIGRYMPLAVYLGRKGYRISVLMPSHNPKRAGYILPNTENVFVYETGRSFFKKIHQGRKNYSTFILGRIGLQNIIRSVVLLLRLNPDVMIICKPLPVAGIAGLFFKFFKRGKVILDCDDAEIAINSLGSGLQRGIINIFENFLPRVSNMVLVNTEYNLSRIKKMRPASDKIHYIPNGVDVMRFSSISSVRIADKKNEGNKIVLYYGDLSFTSGHNVDILLKAFKIFLSKYPLANLLIIGDGKDEGALKDFAKQLGLENKIVWKGRIYPEEVPNYVAACDVVVDPVKDVLSNRARSPIKIVEAMYLGKPVVTSDVGDRKKILGDFGFFCCEGDSYSMAEKLTEAIESEDFKKNKNLVINRALDYSWDKLTDKVEIILKEVLTK